MGIAKFTQLSNKFLSDRANTTFTLHGLDDDAGGVFTNCGFHGIDITPGNLVEAMISRRKVLNVVGVA